jgi:hypothetical protein
MVKDRQLPLQRATEYAHNMGLKFDLMFRLGILGGLGVSKSHEANFVRRHPEWRQQLKDGTFLEKASYAYPEVQQLMLDLINDSCQKIDADGINLCFVRGPHFLQFEKPVLDAFQSEYGTDPLTLPEDDPRFGLVRAKIMTRFIRNVRKQLDAVEKKKGSHLNLSVWVWPSEQNVWLGKHPLDEGLDVKTWLREGLLDSVICQEGIDQEYIRLGRKTGAEFVLFTGYRGEKAMSPTTIQKATDQGVSHFAYWDIDAVQHTPVIWKWLRHSGDPEAMATFVKEPGTLKRQIIPLLQINGNDVKKGLKDAVYSGG